MLKFLLSVILLAFFNAPAFAINLDSGFDKGKLPANQITPDCSQWSKNLSCAQGDQQAVDNVVDQLSGSGGTSLWIFGTGNVGIGTTSNVGIGSLSPGQALDVQGTVRANDFIGKSPVLDVRAYGAVCNGTTDDTTAIQAALNAANTLGGATVYIPKNTEITASLVIYSNTYLKIENGATISLSGASIDHMIQNESSVSAQRTITDGAINSGSPTLSSPAQASFTSADVGRTVIVNGAGNGGNTLVAQISSVGSNTSVTLNINAQTTVASGGTVHFYNRDSNIILSGGTWARGSAGGTTYPHTIFFRHADNIKISDLTVTSSAGKYSIAIGDDTNINIQRINFSSYSDGIHLTGPLNLVSIVDIYGTAGDDVIGLTPVDYSSYDDVHGNITNVFVKNDYATSTTTQVKLIGGTGYYGQNITMENFFGNEGSNKIIQVIDDTTGAANYSGLVFDGIYTSSTAQYPINLSPSLGQDVTLKNLFVQNAITGSSTNYINLAGNWNAVTIDGLTDETISDDRKEVLVNSTYTIGKLTLKNILITALGSSSHESDLIYSDGTITDLILNNAQITYTTTSKDSTILVDSGTVNHVYISNLAQIGGQDILFYYTGTVGQTEISNAVLKSANRFGNFYINSDLTLSNLSIDTLANPAIYITTGNAIIRGYGINRVTAWSGLTIDTGGSVECLNPDFPTDVSALTQTNGDVCYNINSSVVTGIGKVISDGTNWHALNFNKILTSNVGIGTTSNPSGNFQLFNNGMANGNVMVGNNVGIGTWMPVSTLGAGGSGTVTSIATTSPITGGTITGTGTIGINTTGPWNGIPAGIVAVSPITFNPANGNVGVSTTGTWNGNAVTATNMSTSGTGTQVWSMNSGTQGWNNQSGSGSNYWLLGNNNVGIATYGTGNNVGIGTSTPSKTLTVGTTGQATIDSSGNFSTSGTAATGVLSVTGAITTSSTTLSSTSSNVMGSSSTSASAQTIFRGSASTTGIAILQSTSGTGATGNYIAFQDDSQNERARIIGANMGIGSINPGSTLDVNGTLRVLGNLAGGTTGNVGIGTAVANSATCDSVCNTANKRCLVGMTVPLTGFEPCSASISGDCLCLPQN